MASLQNMLARIEEGQSYNLPFYSLFAPPPPTLQTPGGFMRVTGRAFSNGDKGLEFQTFDRDNYSVGAPYTLRMQVSNGYLNVWQFSVPNVPLMTMPSSALSGTFSLNNPLTADITAELFSYQANTSITWAGSYRATSTEMCVGMTEVVPIASIGYAWCWSHDLSRARFSIGVDRGLPTRQVWGSDATFGL